MFKERFKYYKAKWPLPDTGEVLDFEQPAKQAVQQMDMCRATPDALPPGLRPVHEWRCYTLAQHPGLMVVRNPFTVQGQRYWMARCLRDYPRHPNKVNLNARLFAASVIADWWAALQQCSDRDERRRMKISMRWTTLGYHHDWDTKVYSDERRTAFPADLAALCGFFTRALGFEGFKAEAAIVNYYPIGTTLAGHTDHSEPNQDAPLLSFSFGQTAIFLIGGQTKEEKPTALFLRSGDTLIMSRQSRLCYHAVPRVMKARTETWKEPIPRPTPNAPDLHIPKRLRTEYDADTANEWSMDMALYGQVADEIHWSPYCTYINDSRININVRQVLHGDAAATLSPSTNES